MSIFNKNTVTQDDEKVIYIIIQYLNNKVELNVEGKCTFTEFEKWKKIIVYEDSIWFYHKLDTEFGFITNENRNTLLFRNHHRQSHDKKKGNGTFVIRKLTQLFQEVCKVKKIPKLVILFEIWGIENSNSESVRKLLLKEGYKQIQEKDPEEWLIQFNV